MEHNTRAQLTTADSAAAYILAGNAIVTLVSKRTGARFTYKVRKPNENSPHFVSLLRGADNTDDYSYIGTIFHGTTFRGTRKSRVRTDSPSYRAFAWAFDRLASGGPMPEDLEVWHEGRCGACGRTLTVPESIASGLGPVCAGKSAA